MSKGMKGGARRVYGLIACPDCGKECVVKVNDRGTLSARCDWCDSVTYRQPGTVAHDLFKARCRSVGEIPPAPAADPAPAPAADPAPRPAPRKKANVLDL